MLRHHDIDGDGVEELLLGGINDGYNKAFLAVFDPAKVGGYGPVPQEFTPTQASPGTEKYYLMFPFSPLPPLTRWNLYNMVIDLEVTGSHEVNVYVQEWHTDSQQKLPVVCRMLFSVDDRILQLSEKYATDRLLSKPITRGAIDALKDSVLYWNGSRFVSHATMNKHYQTAQ
jgi:hypothetical protein